MDRLIYVTMTAAQQLLQQQAVAANNLANAGTTGFKAETSAFRVAPVAGPGLPTRAYAMETTVGADMTPGSLQATGRDLDVALEGDGLFAVQGRDGMEAYTRNGSFALSEDGELRTRTGLPVIGDGGPIVIPADSKVSIGRDGTVSVVTAGQSSSNVQVVGRLKLVNPGRGDVVKGSDGLFHARGGAALEADENVRVTAGSLESSNVNAVTAMVDMITLSRQFEMHMKLLQSAEGNDQRAAQLLSNNAG